MATMTLGQPAHPNFLEVWRMRHAQLGLGLLLDQAFREIERLKCMIK